MNYFDREEPLSKEALLANLGFSQDIRAMRSEPDEAMAHVAEQFEIADNSDRKGIVMGDYEECVWRVGTKLGRTIYAVLDEPGPDNCDVFLGMMETRELAEHVVSIHNTRLEQIKHVTENPPIRIVMNQ